jgi:hypothetical protein
MNPAIQAVNILQRRNASGSSFDSSYSAILARGSFLGYSLPSPATQVKDNALIVAMKASGTWDMLDAFWVFSTDGDQNFSCLNWKNASLYQFGFSNSVFTSKRGWRPNGVDGFGESNFNPSTNGVNYTLNNASRLIHIATAPNTGNRMDGFKSSVTSRSLYLNSNLHTINGGAIGASIDLTGTGVKGILRSSNTAVKFFNGATESDTTATSTGLANETFVLGRSSTVFSNPEIGMYALGANVAAVYNSFRIAYEARFNSL